MLAAVPADAVLDHLGPGADVIVPLANGEPVTVLDAIERGAGDLRDVRVHQMHAVHDRPYLRGEFGDRLRHVSYFLSHVTRPHFAAGTIDLVPNNFSEMRAILKAATNDPLVVAAASRARPPRLLLPGPERRLRLVVHRPGPLLPGGQPADAPDVRAPPGAHAARSWAGPRPTTRSSSWPLPPTTELDRQIAAHLAERIPDGATLQTGIGAIPNAVLSALAGPPRPRHPHRAPLRRHRRPRRAGRGERRPQAAQPDQDRRHLRPRHPAALRLPRPQRRLRAVAGALRERPEGHRAGAQLRVDQLHAWPSTSSASPRPRR